MDVRGQGHSSPKAEPTRLPQKDVRPVLDFESRIQVTSLLPRQMVPKSILIFTASLIAKDGHVTEFCPTEIAAM